jgi:hypothetical protein
MKPLNLIEIKYCIQKSTVTILAWNWIEPSDRWEEGWKLNGACNKDGDVQSLFQIKTETIIWCTKNLIFPHPMGRQLFNEFTYVHVYDKLLYCSKYLRVIPKLIEKYTASYSVQLCLLLTVFIWFALAKCY